MMQDAPELTAGCAAHVIAGAAKQSRASIPIPKFAIICARRDRDSRARSG